MAEEVKIVDVAGGPAAEATLQEILKLMKSKGSGGGGSGGGTAAASKAQDLYTTAVTRGTKTRKDNTRATRDSTGAVENFGNTLSSVGNVLGSAFGAMIGVATNLTNALGSATTIGGVLEAVPIFGSVLSSATGYFQASVDTFRRLSDVGAGFGNDMMAMRSAAAESGLSLDQFASAIGNNSERLRYLGATGSQGAKVFGQISKTLRSTQSGLMQLGFTQEEVNEGLMDYIENQASAGRLQGRSNASLAKGAEKYMKELDLLSKVTGKSRKELQDEANARNQAANINVLAARLSGDALDNFNNNMSFSSAIMGQSGPAFSEALADMADGVSQTPLAQFLESNIPGLKELQEQNASGAITQKEYSDRLTAMLPKIHELSDSMGAAGTSAMLGAEGAAEFTQMTADSRKAGQTLISMQEAGAAQEAARAEQLRRAPLTATFATFEQTIQNVRSAFETALIDSKILDTVGGLLGDLGTGITSLAQNGVKWLKEYLESPSFQTALVNFKTFVADAAEKVKKFVTDIGDVGFGEAIKNLFSGDGGSGIDIGGMFGDFISSAFSNMLPSLDTVLIGLAAGIGAMILAPFAGIAAVFVGIGAGIVAMIGWDKIKGFAVDSWNAITGVFSGIGDWWDTVDIMGPLTDMFSSVTAWFDSIDIMGPLNDMWGTVKGWFGSFTTWFDSIDIMGPLNDMWGTVKGWFTFGEDATFSISAVGKKMWESVTGWFDMSGTDFSISALGQVAWEAVKGWFSFGADAAFSISQLATDAWTTVTGWFGFGEGTEFSISQLASDAWNTVTGWFGFGDMEMPSISDMFTGIIDKVKGFFDFDFEMPSFKSFLPSWMGGDSEEPGTTATSALNTPAGDTSQAMLDLSSPANISAMGGLDFTSQAESARELHSVLADIGGMQSFNNELERIQLGLDNSAVDRYNSSMEKLVATLEQLNDVLSEDNKGMLGGGTGVSAASMISDGSLGGGSGSGSSDQAQRLNTLIETLITLQREGNRHTSQTVAAISNNLQAGIG